MNAIGGGKAKNDFFTIVFRRPLTMCGFLLTGCAAGLEKTAQAYYRALTTGKSVTIMPPETLRRIRNVSA